MNVFFTCLPVTDRTSRSQHRLYICFVALLVVYSVISLSALLSGRSRWLSGKASASRVGDPGFESRLRRDFFGSSDLKTGNPVTTLPGAWRYRVSAGTGGPVVSIL